MHEDVALEMKQLERREADAGEAKRHAFHHVPLPLARPVAPKEDWTTDAHAACEQAPSQEARQKVRFDGDA